jgi:hypothetical protein
MSRVKVPLQDEELDPSMNTPINPVSGAPCLADLTSFDAFDFNSILQMNFSYLPAANSFFIPRRI